MNIDINSLLTIVVSLVVGIGSSYITFRLQFERFESMDKEREKHWIKWRDDITIDVEELKKAANITQIALLAQTVEALVKRVEDLWKYTADIKHLQVDPYVRATDLLKQRVEKLEKH